MEDLIKYLDCTSLFSALPALNKGIIAQHLKSETIPKGKVFINENEPGDILYILVEGEVSVFAKDPEFGVEFELNRMKDQGVLGEIALLTGEQRTASVRALTDIKVITLEAQVVQSIFAKLPNVTLDVAKGLALRVSELSKSQGITFYNPRNSDFDPSLIEKIPKELLEMHKILPLSLDGDLLTLGMVDPRNKIGCDEVRRCFHGRRFTTVAMTETHFRLFLEKALQKAKAKDRVKYDGMAGYEIKYLSGFQEQHTTKLPIQAQMIPQIVDKIIGLAVDKGASDIHIEPEREAVAVRYRIDGSMQRQLPDHPFAFGPALVSRIKLLSDLDINERRIPQDGRINLTLDKREIDLRVSTLPSRYGEKVAMRIIDSSSARIPLDQLILSETACSIVEKMIFSPNGLIIVTGPTGSGKSTTLFSTLFERISKNPNINVVAAEDPIEITLPGVTQVEVNDRIGLTFAKILRSFLRQDPNIMLVGEMRDHETATIAIEASMTGHLVFTTLHTNSAVDSFGRLFDLGCQPFQVSDALIGIISQRLVRRNCPKCVKLEPIPADLKDDLQLIKVLNKDEDLKVHIGKGCQTCIGSGYRGRTGVYEILWATENLRRLIYNRASGAQLREEGLKKGLIPIERYARFLLDKGLTTPLEIRRIIRQDMV